MSTQARSVTSLAAAATAVLTFGLAPGIAQAVDFEGYFRAGPGATSKNAARACYNLDITGGHYRLGNECDFYGEFGLIQAGKAGGVDYKAEVMFNEYNPGTDIGKSYSSFNQMYVEGKGFDISPGTNFWIGKRFYGRSDVHILDKFFVNMSGVGAGADKIAIGGGAKLGVAYFKTDGSGIDGRSTDPGNRFNVDVTDIPTNPGGALRITGTFTNGNFDSTTSGKGTNGVGISLEHKQEITAIGATNTAWLQYAQGSAGLDAGFGNLKAESSVKKFLVVESLTGQVGPIGWQAVALFGRQDKDDIAKTPKYNEVSIGGRGSYAFTENFKLLADVGYMQKKPDGSPTQKLAKFTLAPTLSTGPKLFSRPELRFYVTTAKWNAPANDAAGPTGLTGLANGKRTGTSYGFQGEIWF
jgi:maltoporin